jgi:hypothetical protein
LHTLFCYKHAIAVLLTPNELTNKLSSI